jgi:hypothetical protein
VYSLVALALIITWVAPMVPWKNMRPHIRMAGKDKRRKRANSAFILIGKTNAGIRKLPF